MQLDDWKKAYLFVLDGVKRKYPHVTWNSIKPVLRCFRTNLLSCHTFRLPVLWHVFITPVAPHLTLYANLQALISTSRGLEAWGGPWNEFQATNAYRILESSGNT